MRFLAYAALALVALVANPLAETKIIADRGSHPCRRP